MQAQQSVALTLEGAQLERPDWSYQAVRWEMDSRRNGAGNQHRCGHGQCGQQGQAPVEATCPAVLLGVRWCLLWERALGMWIIF